MYLFVYYLKKIMNKKLNVLLFLLIMVITSIALFINSLSNPLIIAVRGENETIMQMFDNDSLPEESKLALTTQLNENNDFLDAYHKGEYKIAFKMRKERMEFIKKLEEERNSKTELPYLQSMILEFDYLSKKGLYFDAPESPTRGVNFITHTVLNVLVPVLFISYVVLLSSDLYTSSYVDGIDTEDTYPLKKSRVISSKLISMLSIVCVLFFGYVIFSLIISSLFFGTGDLSYPYVGYEPDLISLKVYPIKELLLKGFSLCLLLFLCSINLVSLLSNVIKNRLHLFFVSIIFILSQSHVMPYIPVLNIISPFFPFIYLKSVDSLSLNLAHQVGNRDVNYYFGVIVIVGWSVVLYYMSKIIRKAR